MTYEELTGDLSQVNYSSLRAGLQMALRDTRAMFGRIQSQIVRPFFVAWLEEAFARGYIVAPKGAPEFLDAPDAYANATWIGPGETILDPVKEVLGDAAAEEAQQTTLEATVPFGTTVAQLLAAACDDGALDPQDLPRTEVYLNGVLMEDRLAALDVRPGPDSIVNVVVMPQGGRGGEKALESVLQLAIMVAAFAVAGPGGSLANALTQAGIKGGMAVAIEAASMATINIAGSLALASIFGNLNKPTTTDPTYNLESQSNQARQREPMPLQCGGARVALDVAASAYNTLIDNVQYITAIYGCDYLDNPDMVSGPEGAGDTAGGFWKLHALNVLADADDVVTITKRINGGLNGLSDREVWLKRTKAIWAIS